tara:strand:+ start:189 stop:398 length:210 start_codon:yes stop_codon:yes gene_type:complete
MNTINLAVLLPALKELDLRHHNYGVQEQHYDTFGRAQRWTLETGLREAFTREVKKAWTEAYLLMTSVMK